jgi:hypothetical protein
VFTLGFVAVLTTVTGWAQQGDRQTAAATTTVNAVTATVTLGGGLAVKGAQGIELDPSTGLVYIGLNGVIVARCPGDGSIASGTPTAHLPGENQISVINPALGVEVAAVASGGAPVWPTADPDRQVVYMSNSGTGNVTVHAAATGVKLGTISVGGMPHKAGLDFSTRRMVVSNTVRASNVSTEQIYASLVDTSTNGIVREFTTPAAPHGVVVDQDRDLIYMSSVITGEISVLSAATGLELFRADPNSAYGAGFGNNNLLARQAATRRLFQVNSQTGATGVIVVDEITLRAERVITFGTPAVIPWGLWVDEPNRLLFAALPNANVIGVADLDTMTQVASIPVGDCPYAVTVDPTRRIGVTSNQGSLTANATASIFDLCPVYAAAGRIVTGCPGTPSFGATNLLGLADGANLALAWKNLPGAATLTLDVTGAYTGSLPLSSSAEAFQYSNVPPGTYMFSVGARNTSGASASSSAVTLTFPGSCSVPLTPTGVVATSSGRTVTVSWDLPASGPAPTSYVVNVTGAYVGSVPTTTRSVAGTVTPGSYTLNVAAVNRCGSGASTASQTIVVS